jgi:alkylation response protein AidB-like acyl-CoA dehydrogenase
MQKCLDVTLPYVHTRKQFGIPIAHNQLVQAKLADMYVKLAAARAYTYAAAKAVDEGTVDTRDCAGAIMFASDRAVECALDTIQCMGGNGYINEIPAGRLLRDSKVRNPIAPTRLELELILYSPPSCIPLAPAQRRYARSSLDALSTRSLHKPLCRLEARRQDRKILRS